MQCTVRDLQQSRISRFYQVSVRDLNDVSNDHELVVHGVHQKSALNTFHQNIKVFEGNKLRSVYYRASNTPYVLKLVA